LATLARSAKSLARSAKERAKPIPYESGMTKLSLLLVAALPAVALAHGGPANHPADPNLHVDSSLEDCSVQFAPELTQAAYGRFVGEFGSISAFKLMSPSTTLGKWGVRVALEYMKFNVEEKADAWNDTFAHPDEYHELGSHLDIPKLSLHVGVTDRIDVGAYFTKQPKANYGWLGVDLKYGLLQQTEAMPISLAVRGAYTKTLFVDDMDMHALGADVAAGRTFWGVLTPYVGVGSDLVVSRETSPMVELDTEVKLIPHALAGLEVRYWHVAIGAEAQLATVPSYQMTVAAVF
jgi:hypothetical protein